MKTTLNFGFALCAMLSLLACNKEDLPVNPKEQATTTLNLTIEQPSADLDSKVYLGAETNDVSPVLWSANDKIKVHYKFYNVDYLENFTLASGQGTQNGVFTGSILGTIEKVYYPASFVNNSGSTITMTLPQEQTYSVGNIPQNTLPMRGNPSGTMNSLSGILRLQIYGGNDNDKIRRITISSDYQLSGDVTFDNSGMVLKTAPSDVEKTLCLDCTETGAEVEVGFPTAFNIILPPSVTAREFTVNIEGFDNKRLTKTIPAKEANIIKVRKIIEMPALEMPAKISNIFDENDAIYDEDDHSKMEGTKTLEADNTGLWFVGDLYSSSEYNFIRWSSSDESVLKIEEVNYGDGFGTMAKFTALLPGTSVITVKDDDDNELSFNVNVKASYIENGITLGEGIRVGNVVWAPINCGYVNEGTDYIFGKLYQWGRKYGQGYLNENVGSWVNYQVAASVGNSADNATAFYYTLSDPYDWCTPQQSSWISDYDPCPTGWRIPYSCEFSDLINENSSPALETDKVGGVDLSGIWLNGTASPEKTGVFLPAAGYRDNETEQDMRSFEGFYWASTVAGEQGIGINFYAGYASLKNINRAYGISVRCVKK